MANDHILQSAPYTDLSHISQRTRCVYVRNSNRLMLCEEKQLFVVKSIRNVCIHCEENMQKF
jgi:hypothetical protein